ncbi:SRPBCC family protein [Leeuwenhoekiella sp. NPDC079379]|uniref:SRPBCC family protein n=1 Tax=Leeuwenhoekiella sp. NPDC079379 TaxID=3364122 RepID=UPI0037CAD14B
MKYTHKIIIDLPLEETVKKMDNLDNLKKWQKGLTQARVITGKFGDVGTQTELKYDFGNRKMTLIETILETNMPHSMVAEYRTKGVLNIQNNTFTSTEDGKTIWKSDSEFKFDGFGMKMLGLLVPGTFKKQSLKYMRDFKKFAESKHV